MEGLDRYSHLWQRLTSLVTSLVTRLVTSFDLDRKFRSVQLYAAKHPVQSLAVLLALCILSIPVGFFLLFAAGSIAFTFFGFMFVEGTILTIAGLMLGGILAVVCFFAITFGGITFIIVYLLNTLWNSFNLSGLITSRSRSQDQGQGRFESARGGMSDGLTPRPVRIAQTSKVNTLRSRQTAGGNMTSERFLKGQTQGQGRTQAPSMVRSELMNPINLKANNLEDESLHRHNVDSTSISSFTEELNLSDVKYKPAQPKHSQSMCDSSELVRMDRNPADCPSALIGHVDKWCCDKESDGDNGNPDLGRLESISLVGNVESLGFDDSGTSTVCDGSTSTVSAVSDTGPADLSADHDGLDKYISTQPLETVPMTSLPHTESLITSSSQELDSNNPSSDLGVVSTSDDVTTHPPSGGSSDDVTTVVPHVDLQSDDVPTLPHADPLSDDVPTLPHADPLSDDVTTLPHADPPSGSSSGSSFDIIDYDGQKLN